MLEVRRTGRTTGGSSTPVEILENESRRDVEALRTIARDRSRKGGAAIFELSPPPTE
jgi:hypothetical protein